MALHRWLGAILITSLLGLTACGKPPSQNGGPAPATTTSTGSSQTTAPSTPATVASATPEATASASASASASPAASGTPVASATGAPASGGGDVEEDYANAEGMDGFEEVKALKAPASSPESIAAGKAVFEGAGTCATCHGATGAGDGDAGKALDPPPRNLHAAADYKYGAGPHGIYRTVMYGVEGTGMAPLEGVLTEEQIWQVTAYVQSLQGK
jgi:mono/diheme cytochrome c family protein